MDAAPRHRAASAAGRGSASRLGNRVHRQVLRPFQVCRRPAAVSATGGTRMTPVRAFSEAGIEAFRNWLTGGAAGGNPDALVGDPTLSEPFDERAVDPTMKFASRYEFGRYLQHVLS